MLHIVSVSELVGQIKGILESSFKVVVVEGEISNLRLSSTGHIYCTISDQQSSLTAVIFKMDILKNPIIKKIKDGTRVLCQGGLNVYVKRGVFQLVIKKIYEKGKGLAFIKFEELKKKLASEGLFSLETKKKIPKYPKKIAIITSPVGAVINDIINVMRRRSVFMDLTIIPSLVQGKGASDSICNAIDKAEKFAKYDVLVLARGGGSAEDLFCYNDEKLARKIYDCSVPIISAIGHQVDYTISDFVADLRAETPSSAAEVLSEGQSRLNNELNHYSSSLNKSMTQIAMRYKVRLEKGHPNKLTQNLWIQYNHKKRILDDFCSLRKRVSDLLGLYDTYLSLDDFSSKSISYYNNYLKEKNNKLNSLYDLLSSLNPKNILKRGYSIVRLNDNCISSQKQMDQVPENERLEIEFHDGISELRKTSI